MAAVFDTNILIDHLSGIPAASATLLAHAERYISRITWIEVMVGTNRPGRSPSEVRTFLDGFRVIELDAAIAEESVTIRQSHGVKVPDAIIFATARRRTLPLVTRNTKDFPATLPGVVIPYDVPAPHSRPTRRILPPPPAP
jgi:hypothetical protein